MAVSDFQDKIAVVTGENICIDSWKDQASIDVHHQTPMMQKIVKLREKYDLHMIVERYVEDSGQTDGAFIRN